ncbi:hypothetical protein CNCMI4602_0559 [Bifidobacterium animalis subsp. animalis]|nr:hypothetical protein CNCMI4602_0559 [Bifidobacterium animalis subsp. animalis]
MNAQIWYVVLLSVIVIAALIGTSIVLGQSKNGLGGGRIITPIWIRRCRASSTPRPSSWETTA